MHQIRVAGPEHAATVGRLLAEFNREFDSEGQDADAFARRFATLLARDDVMVLLTDPDPVGFALVTFRPTPYADGPLAQLEELYVAAAHRSGGWGAALLRALATEARSRGTLEVLINVDSDDTDTRRFYERHGYSCADPDSGSTMLCYLGTPWSQARP